jgi:2-dehydro-3-deoxyphosphogluconate aldolase / (4S)-4-hydroxy-2-oxoglutarate aldolase
MHEDRNVVFSAMHRTGLLPVIPHADLYSWQNIIDVCYHCGIRVIEFRDGLSGKGAGLFKELVAYSSQYPGFYFGVNTIQIKNAGEYIQGGASFITSSFMKEEMARVAGDGGIPWIPGCSSTVELDAASRLGASGVSLLPGSFSANEFEKLQRDYPHLGFIPSAGIRIKDHALKEWTRAGILCVRMSSQVFALNTIVKDWIKIEQNILSVISTIKSVRKVGAGHALPAH